VNVSGDEVTETYDPGDSVAVEGVIDEPVDNEDVTIRFKKPSGTTDETVNFGEPSSNGNFDAVFEIPNTADEGVWTVEVDYDDEKSYTYFIVDDDADTIQVVLDEDTGIYEAGSDVTISGQVDNDDLSTDKFVRIIVLDPANDEILDEDEVELGDGTLPNDEFEYELSLDNDASHGRYAVKVTYSVDDQEGSALFEIEDEDAGSGGSDGGTVDTVTSDTDGDLSAEIDEATYGPGGTVTITGTIDGYDRDDNDELIISILDPDDLEIERDSDATVDEDGNDGVFEFEYDLDDNADEGGYTITITYANDEVELVFEVEEGSSGGGSGTEGLTAKLNKSSYLAGEILTVSGTVQDVKENDEGDPEEVSILVYRPTGQVILQASKYVVPSSNGAFSASIVLSSNLEVDDDYKVIVSYVDEEDVEILFDITGVSSTPSDELTVETDKDEYGLGSTVRITGSVPASLLVQGERALVLVEKPDGGPCRSDQISVESSGSFSYSMITGGNCGLSGEYEVIIRYGDEEGSATFELVGTLSSAYNLNVAGKTYPMEYELTSGTINSISVPKGQNDQLIPKLVIRMNAEDDGQLTLELPREVIDAVEDGEDIDYVVTIEDESGNIITVDVEENNSSNARTLVIDYRAGAERIEITGTQVVPEFGTIAAMIMAVAIVGIIAATARYNKLSLFRQ
jgi:predicted secreted protein with PEFG-CTERM motif